MEKDKRLMEAYWSERLRGKLGLFLMGWAILSKSWIQFSVDGWGCVSSLLFDQKPNYGRGNEDRGDLLQKVPCTHSCTQYPQPCSRPPVTHTSVRDSWTLRRVWVSLLWGHCSFLLGLGVHKILFVPFKSLFPQSFVSSGGSMVGLMATSFKRAYAIPRSTAPRAPAPQQSTADRYLLRRHSNTVLSQSLWGLWVLVCTRYVWALRARLAGMGFDSKCDFTPTTVLHSSHKVAM